MAYIRYQNYHVPLPSSPWVRISFGIVLILGGLPPLGAILPFFGMGTIAVGLLVLSYDLPFVRRWRRRSEVTGLRWWRRHKQKRPISTVRHTVLAAVSWPFAVIRWIKQWGRHLRSQWDWYYTTREDIRRTRMRPRRSRGAVARMFRRLRVWLRGRGRSQRQKSLASRASTSTGQTL